MNPNEFAEKFAQKKYKFFADSGQKDVNAITAQSRVGHESEWVAYDFLKSIGLEPTEPDQKVYLNGEMGEKLWCDMRDLKKPFKYHVKGCPEWTEETRGLSWVFQKEVWENGTHRFADPIVADKWDNDDYVILVSHLSKSVVAVLPASQLVKIFCHGCSRDKKELHGKKAFIHIEKIPERFLFQNFPKI